ncbi:MAG TPA: methyltransferase domain-containing protein [Gammaproteobacteria bacterium]|nr:methyltransferase domain-containing protein [Gammaproteobacteria bacterium]
MSSAESVAIKERERNSWMSVAEGWYRRDELLRKGAAPVSEWMLAHAGIEAGQQVLDIASGTGEPAISAARLVGDKGHVTGTDLVEEMLVFAREKAQQAGLENIEFVCSDGETLDFVAGTFDAVTIRWGLMFMPEPEVCLASVRALMKPGGRISIACWSDPEKNPFISLLTKTLGKYMDLPKPPPGAPGIFSFADPERLRVAIETAGFRDVELQEMEIDFIELDSGRAYWEAMSDMAAPVMQFVNQMDSATRSWFIDDVIASADALKQDGVLRMRGTTWLAAAVK